MSEIADNVPKKVTVMLVDDHAIWRGGVRSMLDETEFEVIGEASSGKEAIELAQALHPSLILLDIRMAGGDGLDALQVLKSEHPGAAVVMLTTYDNPTYMARAVSGGASGYLLKGIESEEMLSCLRAIVEGEMLLTKEELVRSLRSVSDVGNKSGDLIIPLTDREQEVLRLLSTGLNNREIANVLYIGDSTVKTHVEHIIGKLGVSDRVQAAVWAARNGLVGNPTVHE